MQLSSEKILRLESLNNWVWNVLDLRWEQGFSHLEQFVQQYGNSQVPHGYKTIDEFRLGIWITNQRASKNQLTDERISKLESLKGWSWSAFEFRWNQGFFYLERYCQEHGHTKVFYNYKTDDGFNLGTWVRTQIDSKSKLSEDRISKLESLGFKWFERK